MSRKKSGIILLLVVIIVSFLVISGGTKELSREEIEAAKEGEETALLVQLDHMRLIRAVRYVHYQGGSFRLQRDTTGRQVGDAATRKVQTHVRYVFISGQDVDSDGIDLREFVEDSAESKKRRSLISENAWRSPVGWARKISIRTEKLPDSWLRFNAMSLLGEALSGLGKHAEAEPLLLEGYAKMQPPKNAASRKSEALERIVKLYESWGKLLAKYSA